jgi:eukaryotic-like serine/threonine-protein kinase
MGPFDRGSVVDDRYEIVRRIARGGGGTVWVAHDRSLGREVALKQVEIPDELPESDRAAAKQRVLREAKAAARLGHPGVVTVYDVLDGGDTVHLVMELVDAPTLGQIVDRDGPLPEEDVARIGVALLDALGAAHDQGIVHRDVKPSNVFVHDEGEARLADFGIASVAGETSLTLTGTALGSPDYIAPEQAQGEPPAPAADLWALGATLYHAVEGVAPFRRTGLIPTLQAVINEPHRALHRAERLRDVIETLLAKDPERRPDTDEVRRRLGAVVTPTNHPPTADDTAELDAAAATAVAGTREIAEPRDPEARDPEAPGPETPGPESPAPEAHEPETPDPATPDPATPDPATSGPDTSEPEAPDTVLAGAPAPSVASDADDRPGGRGPAPIQAPADEVEGGAGRRRPALLAVAVAAVLGLGGMALLLGDADDPGAEVAEAPAEDDESGAEGADTTGDDTTGDDAAGGTPEPDAEAAPDEEDAAAPEDEPGATGATAVEEAGEVPGDWEVHDGATYQVAVPAGWEERAASGNRTDYVDPTSGSYLRVDHTDDPASDPLADWEAAAADFSQRHDGYEELRLERVDYRDYDAAIWEYRYEEGGATLRAVNLNILEGDHAYALNLQSAEGDWDEVGAHLPNITAGFQPQR